MHDSVFSNSPETVPSKFDPLADGTLPGCPHVLDPNDGSLRDRSLRDVDVAERYSINLTTVWRWAANRADVPDPFVDVYESRWRGGDLF